MIIRDMTLNDFDAVDKLMQYLHGLHVTARPDLYVEKEHPYSMEEFEERVTSEKGICIVAEEDGEVVGICFVKLSDRSLMVEMPTAQMSALCVSQAHQRKGIATKLFEEAARRAKEAGAKRLDLILWEFNQAARAFYESLGMKEQRRILEQEL